MTDWQQQLKDAVTSSVVLLELLGLQKEQLGDVAQVTVAHQQFAVRVPRPFIAKMEKGNADDPLLKQVLVHSQELDVVAGYTRDPLAEMSANPLPGLLHKYKTRVLLTLSVACAVNCRYCFRRHFPYEDQAMDFSRQQAVIAYLREHPEINEVILSGGDPLMLKDQRLDDWLQQLEAVQSLTRLRIHTRFPVVIPDRITFELAQTLSRSRLKAIVVLHINHRNEIDDALIKQLKLLLSENVLLLNQSVLLQGVNDDVGVLTELSEKLFYSGVLPYYLHCLDKVQGAAHFDLKKSQVLALYQQLQGQLPGFLVPKLVEERAGVAHKVMFGYSDLC